VEVSFTLRSPADYSPNAAAIKRMIASAAAQAQKAADYNKRVLGFGAPVRRVNSFSDAIIFKGNRRASARAACARSVGWQGIDVEGVEGLAGRQLASMAEPAIGY
jgi:hypothetical protein